MDFIEGIGQRYLMGKANAAPQMLETLAKKQFSSATDTKAQAAQASRLPFEEKDQEIAKLRKQLAEVKSEKGKTTGLARLAKSRAAPSVADSVKSARSSGGSAKPKPKTQKEMKGPSSQEASDDDTPPPSPKSSRKPSDSTRGRRASISTATAAAEARKPAVPSEAKSGSHNIASRKPPKTASSAAASSRRGPEPQLGARDALLTKIAVSQAAPSASSAHASRNRRHSISQLSQIDSENGSWWERGSNAASVATRPPPSVVASRSPALLPPPSPAPPRQSVHHAPKHHSPVSEQVVRIPKERCEDEEPCMYVIEVEEEEEAPMWKTGRSSRQRSVGGKGPGGVVEVSSCKGRTVYRVRG